MQFVKSFGIAIPQTTSEKLQHGLKISRWQEIQLFLTLKYLFIKFDNEETKTKVTDVDLISLLLTLVKYFATWRA